MIVVNTNGYPVSCTEKDNIVIEAVATYVNASGISPIKAGMKLADIHRALHADLFRLFAGWLRQMAVDHYRGRFDQRNKAVSSYAAEIYDFLLAEGMVKDINYSADTLK